MKGDVAKCPRALQEVPKKPSNLNLLQKTGIKFHSHYKYPLKIALDHQWTVLNRFS